MALAAPGVAKPTVKGDIAAWAEIATAYRQLNSLSGYRIKGKVSGGGPGGGSFVTEVAPPNRAYHTIEQTPQGTVEVFSVGDKFVQRLPTGQCLPMGRDLNRIPLLRDPEDPQDNFVYTISRKPDSVIDGTPVHSYGQAIESSRGGQTIPVTIYIGARTGLPRRTISTVTVTMAHQGTAVERTTTMDFYDYGAKINIVLPNC